jgi:Cation transport ATPase
MKRIEAPWSADGRALAEALGSDPHRGLKAEEAQGRLAECGENRIVKLHRITFWSILAEELTEPLILVLIAVGVLYSLWGKLGDTITILLVILTVSTVEVLTEYRAKKSIEALRRLAEPETWALREGAAMELDTKSLVPGDILILKAGVRVGADGRILEAWNLEADESQLTGESVGVAKSAASVGRDAALGDRSSMVHMGSVILKGRGRALVVATGMGTELGRIAGLADEAREPKTPLQKSMKELSKRCSSPASPSPSRPYPRRCRSSSPCFSAWARYSCRGRASSSGARRRPRPWAA